MERSGTLCRCLFDRDDGSRNPTNPSDVQHHRAGAEKTFSLGYYVTMPEGWESFSLLCDLKETSSALKSVAEEDIFRDKINNSDNVLFFQGCVVSEEAKRKSD